MIYSLVFAIVFPLSPMSVHHPLRITETYSTMEECQTEVLRLEELTKTSYPEANYSSKCTGYYYWRV